MSDKISEALDEIDWEGHDEAAHGGALVALDQCVKIVEANPADALRALTELRETFRATFHAPDGEE